MIHKHLLGVCCRTKTMLGFINTHNKHSIITFLCYHMWWTTICHQNKQHGKLGNVITLYEAHVSQLVSLSPYSKLLNHTTLMFALLYFLQCIPTMVTKYSCLQLNPYVESWAQRKSLKVTAFFVCIQVIFNVHLGQNFLQNRPVSVGSQDTKNVLHPGEQESSVPNVLEKCLPVSSLSHFIVFWQLFSGGLQMALKAYTEET